MCAAVARRMSRMPDSGSYSAVCSLPSLPPRPAPHHLGSGQPLERQVRGVHRGGGGVHVRRNRVAVGLGEDQPPEAVNELQPGAPLGDVPALVGGRGQRRVLGLAVGVPDHPGMVLRCPAGVPVLVLLKGQHLTAELAAQPVGGRGADSSAADHDRPVLLCHSRSSMSPPHQAAPGRRPAGGYWR